MENPPLLPTRTEGFLTVKEEESGSKEGGEGGVKAKREFFRLEMGELQVGEFEEEFDDEEDVLRKVFRSNDFGDCEGDCMGDKREDLE